MIGASKRFVLVALFTALLIVLVNLAWWYYYQRTERLLEHQLSHRLTTTAALSAQSLDPFEVNLVRLGDIEQYIDLISQLESIRRIDSLSEVFLLDENYQYLATTALEPDSVYFLASLYAPLIDSFFFAQTENPLPTPTYRSGDVYLKTAFAPVIDSQGLVTAVLGVEANVDYAQSLNDLRANLTYATALSLIGGLLMGVVFLLLQRRINHTEQRLFLNESHAHLGRMVAVVAHELRNPLMIIRASAERIRKKTDMNEAGFVLEEVDRLNDIVTGYLDFARSGGSLLASDQPAAIDLPAMIENIRRHLSDKYSGETITWLGDCPDKLTFTGYPRSLRQVLLNLLINGVESCREAQKPVEVGIAAVVQGAEIELKILDHGRGITAKELKKVFTPFYTTRQAGSGLGLYLSRRIVEEMGGRMSIHSEMRSTPDSGTEVTVRLPKTVKRTDD